MQVITSHHHVLYTANTPICDRQMVAERDQLLLAQQRKFNAVIENYHSQLAEERINSAALRREEEHLRFR